MPFPASRPNPVQQPPAGQPAQQPARQWGGAASSQPAPAAAQPPPAGSPAAQPPLRAGWGGGAARTQHQVSRSPFAGVEEAQVNQRNDFLSEGTYLFKILNVIYKDGHNKEMMIVEGMVLVSNYDPQTAPGARQEGTKANCYMMNAGASADAFLGNLKGFIIAASGFDKDGNARPLDDIVTQQECEDCCGPDQSFAGTIVYVKARAVTTKAGNPFTAINYHPAFLLPDGTPDINKCFEVYGA